MSIKSRETKFGFVFGSMEVSRTCLDKSVAIISIKTPKTQISIRATKTGCVRFYDDHGNELELVNKELIKRLTNAVIN